MPRKKRVVPYDKIPPKVDVERFTRHVGTRLVLFREKFGYTQDAVGDYLGCGKANISKWETGEALPQLGYVADLCTLYHCTYDELLGNFNEAEDSRRVEFVLRTPSSKLLTDSTQVDIQHGIEILYALVSGKRVEDLYTIPSLSQYKGNRDVLFALLRTALISGEITFTHIPQSEGLERELVRQYPQLEGSVHVVDLPDTMISEALPPELVAWTAARQVMAKLKQPTRVGIGYSYTLYRMCLTTPPTTQQFNGTQWIPLITYAGKESVTIHSANYLSALMAYRHFKSKATYLPYVPPEARPSHRGLETIRRDWELLNVAFVGGFPWSKESNFRVAASLRTIYRELENTEQINTIAGEFLGYILDRDGNVVKEAETAKATTRISLEDIRRTAENGKVYFVGGLREKAPIIRVALHKGYINGLVTDSQLAKALLE